MILMTKHHLNIKKAVLVYTERPALYRQSELTHKIVLFRDVSL